MHRTVLIIFWVGVSSAFNGQAQTLADAWVEAQQHASIKMVESLANSAKASAQAIDATQSLKVDLTASVIHLDDDINLYGSDLADATSTGSPIIDDVLSILAQDLVTTIGDQTSTRASLVAAYPLYSGGKTRLASEIALLEYELAEADVVKAKQLVFIDVVRRYLNAAFAEQALALMSTQLKAMLEHQQNAVSLEREGQIAAAERILVDAQVQKLRVAVHNQQLLLDTLYYALGQVASITKVNVKLLAAARSLAPYDAATQMQCAINQSPTLKHAQIKQRQSLRAIELASADYKPTVALVADVNLYRGDSLIDQTSPDWAVGIAGKMPLLDGGSKSNRVLAAKALSSASAYEQQISREHLLRQVRALLNERDGASHSISGLDTSIVAAKENLRLRTLAFKQGLGRAVDVLDALASVQSTQTLQQEAAMKLILSQATLAALCQQYQPFLTSIQGDTL